MRITIEISDDKIINFSPSAKSELKSHINRLAEDIVDEASRIEASRRISDANSEVTQPIVREAATQPKMAFVRKGKFGLKIIQGIAFLTSMISGALLDVEKFQNISIFIWFLITFFIAIATNVYTIFNKDNNG